MPVNNLIERRSIAINVSANSKRQLLQIIADLAERHFGLSESEVFDAISDREKQASTGLGHGVAVPHAIVSGLSEMRSLFIRLETPIDFGAIDDLPVDLVFVLLSPPEAEGEHLRALAKLSRLVRQKELRNQLRTIDNADAVYALLSSGVASNAA